MAMDQNNQTASSVSSFCKAPFKYKEQNTMLLYQNIRMNLQNVVKGIQDVDKNLKNLEGDIVTMVKLINAIEPTEAKSTSNDNIS